MEYVDHHLAHAASAFHSSGYEEAAIIVVDGNGEDAATSIGYGDNRKVRLDQKIGISHSLGHFYTFATCHVGFGSYDEGKLMGLAAYGQPVYDLDLIYLDEDGYHMDLVDLDQLPAAQRFRILFQAWDRWFVNQFGAPNYSRYSWNRTTGGICRELDPTSDCANLAASVQQALNETILHLAQLATKRYNTRRLVLAGGVALNCTANGILLNSGLVDELYIVPAAHDSGGALGAAFYIAAQNTTTEPLASPYFGPYFEDMAIADQLRQRGIPFIEPADVAEHSANLLADGLIIGWFNGRMEIGPRALGHRSILALPTTYAVRDRVNRIKGRELWRPLSPSILATAVPDLLSGKYPSPYMLTAVPVTDQAKTLMPAVVHVDDTTRPQIVMPDDEPYYRLLEAIYDKTGIPGVLNTSFNLAGEPMVCTPDDALRTFFCSELDALVFGNLVVHKASSQFI